MSFAGPFSGETRNRTEDTTIFSRMLYQLSYLAASHDATGSAARMTAMRRRPPGYPPPERRPSRHVPHNGL
jgi:hypothetical protein